MTFAPPASKLFHSESTDLAPSCRPLVFDDTGCGACPVAREKSRAVGPENQDAIAKMAIAVVEWQVHTVPGAELWAVGEAMEERAVADDESREVRGSCMAATACAAERVTGPRRDL